MIFDFRLKVFDTVARKLNFTKAAEELHISQPAVTKHIKEIETQLSTQLFERNGTKIKLTEAGEVFLNYTQQIFELYRSLEFDIHELNNRYKGLLKIGASTTIAQYILPSCLAFFKQKFPELEVILYTKNTEEIEQLLADKKIDIGFIEGFSKSNLFTYTSFLEDELVLICRKNHALSKNQNFEKKDLYNCGLVTRELGSGSLETINHHLKDAKIDVEKLKIEIQLGSSESIKSYVSNSDALAFISIYAILNELKAGSLEIIDLKNLEIKRLFQYIEVRGSQNPIVEIFKKFISSYNFR